MSKKTDKPSSARGHIEDNVIRWRLKKELIRVDSKGKPIKGNIPVNTFDRNWLSQQLFNSGGFMPPVVHSPPNPPDNVTSINKNRKPDKPKAAAGNEAENIPDPPAKRRTMDLSFLHDKAMAVDEFRHWSRLSKEIGRKCAIPWTGGGRKGKLRSSDLDAQRKRSNNGHKGLQRLKFKKPPSTVHNPMLSNKPIAPRFNSKGYAPSGKPISDFTVGPFKTLKNPVVYTNQWPFYKQSEASSSTSPPTASKHWHGKAANDSTPAVRKMPTKDSLVFKMNAEVQWFINNVEPQNWPQHIHNFAHWKGGGPTPNTGAINKAAADPATRERLINALYQGLLEDWKMLDSALEMSNQNARLLQQELDAERQQNRLMEYDLAMRGGESPDDVREAYIKPKTPQVPDDADVMLAQFNVYQSFVKCDGPEHAFARYVYGDPRLGQVIRDQADMRCEERQAAFNEREYWRVTLPAEQAAWERGREQEYSDWWNQAYPQYLKSRLGRHARRTAVRNPESEALSLAMLAHKAKKSWRNPDSIYYSAQHRHATVNNAVAGALISKVKPSRNRISDKQRTNYERWWSERADYCEVKYHESHAAGRAKIAFVKSYNKLIDTLNTPVDYGTRKRQRQTLERIRTHQAILDEQRERRKEERVKRKAERAVKQRIREAQRIAH